jgi:hypothetical protein
MDNSEIDNINIRFIEDTTSNTIFHDLEGQNIINLTKIKPQQVVPLTGFFRKTDGNLVRDTDLIIIDMCRSTIVIAIILPFIVSDLYFGFKDNYCINKRPKNVAISMKQYLIVSGFACLLTMINLLKNIWYLPKNDNTNTIKLYNYGNCLIVYTLGIFHFIWNILGLILFWSYIFYEDKCDKQLLDYLFISLIIKYICSLSIFNCKNCMNEQ